MLISIDCSCLWVFFFSCSLCLLAADNNALEELHQKWLSCLFTIETCTEDRQSWTESSQSNWLEQNSLYALPLYWFCVVVNIIFILHDDLFKWYSSVNGTTKPNKSDDGGWCSGGQQRSSSHWYQHPAFSWPHWQPDEEGICGPWVTVQPAIYYSSQTIKWWCAFY